MKRLVLVLVVLIDCALALPAARALETDRENEGAALERSGARAPADAAAAVPRMVDVVALGFGARRAIGMRAPQSSRSFRSRSGATRDEAPAPPLLDRPDAEWAVPRTRLAAALTPCAPEEDPIDGRIYSIGLCAVAGREARLFQPHLFTSIYAETFPLERVGLWGGQQTYRTLRGSVAVGFEAGAAVRLREHVNLTAGFRLLGYGPGENGPLDGGSLDPSMTAPLLGLAIKY